MFSDTGFNLPSIWDIVDNLLLDNYATNTLVQRALEELFPYLRIIFNSGADSYQSNDAGFSRINETLHLNTITAENGSRVFDSSE